jgi:hypothetical protein
VLRVRANARLSGELFKCCETMSVRSTFAHRTVTRAVITEPIVEHDIDTRTQDWNWT